VRHGLDVTFKVLGKTRNEAAVDVLLPALDGAHQAVQDGALGAMLSRRGGAAQRELLRRWPNMPQPWKERIKDRPGRLNRALRDAILDTNRQSCAVACEAVRWLGEYDLAPALINAAEDTANPNAELVATTLLQLVAHLYDELAAPRDYSRRRDPQIVRGHVVSSLELSLERFDHHRRLEIVESLLMLASRDNATVKRVLFDPHHQAYLAVVDTLTHSPRPGVMRLLLSWLDDPQAPSAALTVVSHRNDPTFLKHLFRKIGHEPSGVAKCNLRRMRAFGWIQKDLGFLERLDASAQYSAVQMTMASGMNRLDVFKLVSHLMTYGNPGGRRAASRALAEFKGVQANQLALAALNDDDPQVQANVVVQLRDRGIPGALNQLIALLDSPHRVVADAARSCLPEFSFQRFLSSYELLDDETRETTGMLVRKVDPATLPKLEDELMLPDASRRLRALDIARCMECVDQLEDAVLETLADTDHLVRTRAATVLAQCTTERARDALQDALNDRSFAVREAAEASLGVLQAAEERSSQSPAPPAPIDWSSAASQLQEPSR